MICPICKIQGHDVSYTVIADTIFIKEKCINEHYFGKTRYMTDVELQKFRPFKSLRDVMKKFERC